MTASSAVLELGGSQSLSIKKKKKVLGWPISHRHQLDRGFNHTFRIEKIGNESKDLNAKADRKTVSKVKMTVIFFEVYQS